VGVYLNSKANGQSTRIACTFPAGNTKGTVPASVVGKIPQGEASVVISAVEENTLDVAGWAVTLTLESDGMNKNGYAAGYAMFQ